jgi:(p)ppGpp synthase/HD superfamily hydrolase
MMNNNTNQFDKALMVSVNAYNRRLDKAGVPYVLHPLRIAAKFPDNEPWAVIARLHDVVEDTLDNNRQITLPDIEEEFGENIATQVGL